MSTHIINGEKIHIEYDSERAFWGGYKYHAITDSYDPSPYEPDGAWGDTTGYGDTEQEALEDLLWQLDELK
jgi:hypothetical protein